MHVDDGQVVHNSVPLYNDLITILEKRYGPLTHNNSTTSYLGQAIAVNPSGRVSYSMEGYIRRLCKDHNTSAIAIPPSDTNVFQPPTETAPANKILYQSLVGGLIYCLKTRTTSAKKSLSSSPNAYLSVSLTSRKHTES